MAALSLLVFSCATATAPNESGQPIPNDWLQISETTAFPNLSYDAGGVLLYTPRKPTDSAVHIVRTAEGAKLVNGDTDLTPVFPAIDSFDVSLDRKEVAFSAKRSDNFDIGLVALQGSEVSWVPPDRADEIAVQYAPRGNKISYIVRTRGGDLVRTVHIPTATPLTVTFPYGRVHSLAWEPRAERYAVSWSSVDASDRVELMTYSGDERKMLVPPALALDVSAEPAGGATLLRPNTMRYGETLPLVVWRAGSRDEWSDARGSLQRAVPVACAVIDHDPDAAFWTALAAIPWIDMSRVFVIGALESTADRRPPTAGETGNVGGRRTAEGGRTWIVSDASVPPGTYRTRQNIVAVAPALVQSFGAAFVAHQLKGHPPLNGSHR